MIETTEERYERVNRWLLGLAERQVTAAGGRATFVSDIYFEAAEVIASLRARIADLEKKLGKSPDGDRVLMNEAPAGLRPSGVAPFCEAEQDRDLKDAIGKALWWRGGNHPGDWERIETDYRVEACFQAIRDAGYAVVPLPPLSARGEEDARASDDELPGAQRSPDTNSLRSSKDPSHG